ncbi:MFS transporter [Salinibacterium sp. dk2585]|uniref:MFS transporter n=1 Tax=unclassified Salinibacterium TaxID=2632331 RepID=UPI0011C25557|nr:MULTISPECIES: MFS transporter [unclassified Salinibacterium]QEE60931.1 MFS transporter [Salinibacterium sp. dk2585]TXK56002.1 MFS transporter [Salinibacterium sp. dk5596]
MDPAQEGSTSQAQHDDTLAERPGWKRDVAIFLSGQTISLLGSMLVMYAVMWHLTILTGSGTVLMLSLVFGMLPQAVVSIFGGVWADRHNRKLLIMGADSAIAVATLALAFLMASGVDSLWVIYAALAVRSFFAGIQTPAVTAMIPQITPTSQLMRVNGMFQTVQAGMMLLAPAMAAVIYASMDIVAVFFIDATTALIGVGLLAFIRVPTISRSGEGDVSYFGDLVAGVRYIASNSSVKWLTALFALVMLLTGAPGYLTPLLVVREFGDEVWKLTVNELAWGVGFLAAGALVSVLGPRIRRRVLFVVLALLASAVLTAALGIAPNLLLLCFVGALVAASYSLMNAPTMTILQERVEPEMQGRVFGFVGIVMATAMPVSMVIFGPLADVWSERVVIVFAGLLLVVTLLTILSIPSARRSLAAVDAPVEA